MPSGESLYRFCCARKCAAAVSYTHLDVYKRQVLGNMTETNFRRALLISYGSPKIFFSSVYCLSLIHI